MAGALYQYLADDHERLDRLLRRAEGRSGTVDRRPFDEFRRGLLRHIAIEEKIALPAIARLQGGRPAPMAERLRLDHGALAALLVPSPTPSIIATIRSILEIHNPLEEDDDGMYELLEQVAGKEGPALLEQMKAAPEVPVMPYNTNPDVLEATRRALARAGYGFKELPE